MTRNERLALAVQMTAATMTGKNLNNQDGLVNEYAERIKAAYRAVSKADAEIPQQG